MAKKKSATSAAEKQLKAAVKKLRSQLAAAEKSAEKWKARAKEHKSVAAGFKVELSSVRRRLEKAESSVLKWKDRAKKPAAPAPLAAVPDPVPDPVPDLGPDPVPDLAPDPVPVADPGPLTAVPDPAPTAAAAASEPDESWTVTALRAEARSRGVAGYSRKTKAELLAELRG